MTVLEKVLGIVAASVTLIAGLASTHYHDAVGDLQKEKQQLAMRLEQSVHASDELRKELESCQASLDSEVMVREELDSKWARCTRPGRIIFRAEDLNPDWMEYELAKNDSIEFKLVASSVRLSLVHLGDKGPVLRVAGCDKLAIFSAVHADDFGPLAFRLATDEVLSFVASTDCCERGLSGCDLSYLERIEVAVLDFDVEDQAARVKFRKTLDESNFEET